MPQSFAREPLGPHLQIAVSPQHKFGTDGFLLSNFANPRRKDLVCDLGTGCGIVALLWFRQQENGPSQAVCVDVQPQAVLQLTQTVEENNLTGKVLPLLGDLRTLLPHPLLPEGRFDLVTCNPPYKAPGTGILSDSPSDRIARHETACDIKDICTTAAKLLKFGGRFCLCQRPERLCDVFEAMRKSQLEPKRLRMVQQRPHTAPWLVLVEGKKGAKPFLQTEPPVIIENSDGSGFSPELLKIYGKM